MVALDVLHLLPPIALRTLLRECRRVLRPGGRLILAARETAPESERAGRAPVVQAAAGWQALAQEAGFAAGRVALREQAVWLDLRCPPGGAAWPTRVVHLAAGPRVRPWAERQVILRPDAGAWDNQSARDFALLVSPEKDEVRECGRLVAYYTGYRDDGGGTQRAICRAVSADGLAWERDPAGPVLRAGAPGAWDDGGVAAGSVIALPAGRPARYALYFSGRTADGAWPGIGLALSADGVRWEKQAGRILAVADYPGLRYLALADVIRTAAGRWLMHCEGWLGEEGWAVFQAESPDGLSWRPVQADPVLRAREIPWACRHVANPKCVELAPGRLVLGFNAADEAGAFQLGLAESPDGRRWRVLDVSPVLCTTSGERRLESLFMSRDAWRRGEQRVYCFGAATRATHASSRILTAAADPVAEWPGPPWATQRWGLYRVGAGGLVAQPGATAAGHALVRGVPLERDTQCTLRLGPARSGGGGVRLTLAGGDGSCELELRADGSVSRDGVPLCAAAAGAAPAALGLRIIRPRSAGPEIVLRLWHGDRRVLARHEPLGLRPERLRVAVAVPPDGAPLLVEHVDIWAPQAAATEETGDAHMYMGVCRTGDPLLPDVDGAALRAQLERCRIGRALVVPYGARRPLDSFDQIAALARELPGRVFPLMRGPQRAAPRPEDERFRVLQLELLWQQGLLAGLEFHLGAGDRPDPGVLAWVERRQVLTLWHATSAADLDWLERDVLARHTFPVLLSHFGGYPLDRQRYRHCLDLLDRHASVHLVTSVVFFQAYLAAAVRRHPDRVLLGSDFPAVDPAVARAAITQLDVPAELKRGVLGGNLRFLTERVAWHRRRALRAAADLLFPPLPATPEEVRRQGFEIVPPERLPPEEDARAKEFWSRHASSFYVEHKPWATMIAELVGDLAPRSVLEFGCHVGRNLAAIRAVLPDARLVGLDLNAAAVRAGREQTGLDLRCGSEQALAGFGAGEFDLVFTVSVLDHIPDIRPVCQALLRIAARFALFLEVTLPVEGKVLRHFDHQHAAVRPSTEASYSWRVDRCLAGEPRIWRLESRPCYLHPAALGPYYRLYVAFLDPP